MKHYIYQALRRRNQWFTAIGGAMMQIAIISEAQAQGNPPPNTLPGVTIGGTNALQQFTNGVLCQVAFVLFWVLIVLSVIFVLVAAFKYLTSGGEPANVTSAHKMLTYAAVAILVALVAKGFPLVIQSVFNSTGTPITNALTQAPC